MEDIMTGSEQEILFNYRFAAVMALFLSSIWFWVRMFLEINVLWYRLERAIRQVDSEWVHLPWHFAASFALFIISLIVFVKTLFV
jgi:hypothetical protein